MSRADEARQRLELLATRPVLLRPLDRLRMLSQQLDGVERRLELASDSQLKRLAQQSSYWREKLGAVSLMRCLPAMRIVSRETDSGTRPLGDLAQVPVGQPLRIQVADGSLRASDGASAARSASRRGDE
ncbi:MAG: hypothetical protein R3B96_24875 [Pirellulaceae bacterium]